MQILFTRFPYASALGGAEIQTMALMDGLTARGHQVRFVGSCPTLLARAKVPIKFEMHIGPPPVTKWTAVSFFWRRRKMREQLKEMFNRERQLPDSVFMLSLSEKLLMTEWLASKGVKVFWMEHDMVGPWLTHSPWLNMLKQEAQHAVIICVSEMSRKKYLELGFEPDRVIAIPNGVDAHRFDVKPVDALTQESVSPLPLAQDGQSTSNIHLGCIARLSQEKGVDVLLKTVMDMPEVTLSIVGSGPDEGLLRTMIAEYERREPGSIGRITIDQSVADLGVLYRSLDALVLPSTENDPFGLVVAEAMMLGVATIVTDACGITDYLRNGVDAIITPAGDEQALREAIVALEDTALRQKIAEQGQTTAQATLSLEAMLERYSALLNPQSVASGIH